MCIIAPKPVLAAILSVFVALATGCGSPDDETATHTGALPGESGPLEHVQIAESPPGAGQQTPDRPPPAPAPEAPPEPEAPPPPAAPSPLATPAGAGAAPEAGETALTRETLDRIVEGMSVDDVSALVGRPGVTIASREDSVVLYRWSTEEQSFLAKFEAGKLTRKTVVAAPQESAPEAALTEDAYERVQPGMALEEVLALLDIPGQPVAHQGEELIIYRWSDHLGSSFTARFEDHRLVRKTAFVVSPLIQAEGEGADAAEGEGEALNSEAVDPEIAMEGEGEGDEMVIQIAEVPERAEQATNDVRRDVQPESEPQATEEAPRQVRVIGAARRERELEADDSPYADRSYRPRPKLPDYTWSLSKGAYEIKVKNPTEDTVEVGIRSGDRGRDLDVRPNGEASVFVDQGDYQIHYRYKDNPYAIYRGGLIRIDGAYTADVEVTIIDENYSIRHLQDDGGYRRRP